MPAQPCIFIMASGTGGHVIPALTVAQLLRAHSETVFWLGGPTKLENTLLLAANIPILTLNIRGIRQKGWLQKICTGWMILRALVCALKIFKKYQPTYVLGMGGAVSGCGGLAALILRIPLILH